MKIKANAKINLSLDVLGKRPDGYHEILTVMQALELHDILEVQPAAGGAVEVECSHPAVPGGSDNLACRAAEMLRSEYGCEQGAKIFIEKNIPVEAGLAGGSADAAATMKILNELWDLKAGDADMCRLGEKIGSDVPFCLMGKTALAGGRGEKITPLSPFSGLGVVLVKPPFGVSTARVYSLFDGLEGGSGPDTAAVVKAVEEKKIEAVAALMANVLERVTISLHPEIENIKKALVAAGSSGSLMSGSGPTVFGLCKTPEEARRVAARLKLPGCQIIVTATA